MAKSEPIDQRSATGAKIFVSYSRDNKEFARQISAMLTDMGFEPLMDVRAIHPSEPWQDRLQNLIEQCDKIVFVMTPSYLQSEPCEWEVALAADLNKEMIPVLPAELPESIVVPEALAKLQYVLFYSDEDDPDSGFYTGTRRLEQAIRTDLDWLRLLRLYTDRASVWRQSQDSEQLLKGALLAEALDWKNQTPEESSVPLEIAEFISASEAEFEAEQARREQRARRFALIGIVFTAIAIGLAGLAGHFYRESGSNLADLNKAKSDNALLAQASEHWADGRSSLGRYKVRQEYGEDCEDGPDCSTADASLKLKDALKTLFPTDPEKAGLNEEGQKAYRLITAAIRRDHAEALYHGGAATAIAEMDIVIQEMTRELDSLQVGEKEHSDVRNTLAYDYLRRALYTCNAGQGDLSEIESKLSSGANYLEAAKPKPAWPRVESLISPAPPDQICDEARAALCEYVECAQDRSDRPGSTPPPPNSDAGEGIVDDAPAPAPAPEPAPDDEFELFVEQRLPPTPDAFQIRQVYLHISDESQRAAAKAFQAKLEQAGGAQTYEVVGIELIDVKYRPSIRYYYNIQEQDVEDRLVPACIESAREVITDVSASGQKMLENWTDESGFRLISLDGRYKGLPQNRIEIWL